MRRRGTNEAIALAMKKQWPEAVSANQSIIEVFPDDVDAYNRLGKALTELGRYEEAWDAYQRAYVIDPNNSIARKNLLRLEHLRGAKTSAKSPRSVGGGVDPRVFIEETGKAQVVTLRNPAPREVLARMAAGDPVRLNVQGRSLQVESDTGEYLGEVELSLGLRLVTLIEGGNRYEAAIASMGQEEVRVLIKEVFQHPSQAGRPSFPSRAADSFRPYVRETMLRYEIEDEGVSDEDEYASEWSESEGEDSLRDDMHLVDDSPIS